MLYQLSYTPVGRHAGLRYAEARGVARASAAGPSAVSVNAGGRRRPRATSGGGRPEARRIAPKRRLEQRRCEEAHHRHADAVAREFVGVVVARRQE